MIHILHVVGARPNFMKAAPVLAALSRRAGVRQTLAHTGQHYDPGMSDIFFKQLGLPPPDVRLGIGSGTHTEQTAGVMLALEPEIIRRKPDLTLVYGDINSTVAAALVSSKLRIAVGHVEAGLRSRDRDMPEEINRVLVDQMSDLLFAPSRDGVENLAAEGVPRSSIHLPGNVMIDTLVRLLPHARRPVVQGIDGPFGVLTLHRPANVDNPRGLRMILRALGEAARRIPLVFPVHPRTRARIRRAGIGLTQLRGLKMIAPVGYLEFLALQRDAKFVITDSGGIQEETTYLNVPCLTLRNNTERPVTVTLGTNTLLGTDPSRLKPAVERILSGRGKSGNIPPLWDGRAGERIASIVLAWNRNGRRLRSR